MHACSTHATLTYTRQRYNYYEIALKMQVSYNVCVVYSHKRGKIINLNLVAANNNITNNNNNNNCTLVFC